MSSAANSSVSNDSIANSIIDVIKEEQIKLGYIKERIRLYYPLSSLNIMMNTKKDCEQMLTSLNVYFDTKKDIFGDVEVSYTGERFCINLSEETSQYVHEHTEKSGFLYDLIEVISRHEITIEDVLLQFRKYSDKVHFEEIENDDFNYLIYFEDGNPDSYRYCFSEEGHHIIYHRYTKEDFEELFL